jgi:hypothetical protein
VLSSLLASYEAHLDSLRDERALASQGDGGASAAYGSPLREMSKEAEAALPKLEAEELLPFLAARLSALEGLAGDLREIAEREAPTDDGEDDEAEFKPERWRRLKPALKRVAALLLNYAQGRLALSGMRAAAARRDAELPKFPTL